MGRLWRWIEGELSPPGIRQKRRRSIYRIIARIGEQIASDIAKSKRDFFAYSTSKLDAHGVSKCIPRLPFDTDESYRKRLVKASDVISATGEDVGLKFFLDSYVPGRWIQVDVARDVFQVGSGRVGVTPVGSTVALTLFITNLLSTEEADIKAFLDWFLGADIDYVLARYKTNDAAALQNFLSFYVPNRWRQIDTKTGFFHIGSGRVGRTPIARSEEVVLRISNLTSDEKKEIETFLDWFLGGSGDNRYEVRGS